MFAGRPAACAGWVPWGNREPRDGLRGRTAGADGASRSRYRAVGLGRSAEEGSPRTPSARRALPAIEANPRAGGTARPNTSTRLAGGGPPMAGHVCQSVSLLCAAKTGQSVGKPPGLGPGRACLGAPDGVGDESWGRSGPPPGALRFRKLGFRNRAESCSGNRGAVTRTVGGDPPRGSGEGSPSNG